MGSLSQNWENLIGRAKKSLMRFTHDKDQTHEESVLQQWRHSDGYGLIPADLYEEVDAIYIRVEVPGMGKNDLSIRMVGSDLFISGNKKITREQNKDQFHLMECAFGSFQRVINLPCLVDDTKAQAICKNGVLKIKLPKKNYTKKNQITIN